MPLDQTVANTGVPNTRQSRVYPLEARRVGVGVGSLCPVPPRVFLRAKESLRLVFLGSPVV